MRPSLLFALVFLATVLGTGGAPGAASTITLRADPWCPYNCRPEDERPGYLIELARAVFEPLGHEVEYRTLGWKRAIEAVRKGDAHGLVGAAVDDAPDLIFPEVAAAVAVPVIAVRRGEGFPFAGPESLEGRVLGAILGYEFGGPVGDYLAAHGRDPRRVQWVSGVDGALQNLRKLLAGRIDGVYDDRWVIEHYARRLGERERIEYVALGVRQELGIGFSPAREESRALARAFAEGVRRLRTSGELARLLARYGLEELAPEGRP